MPDYTWLLEPGSKLFTSLAKGESLDARLRVIESIPGTLETGVGLPIGGTTGQLLKKASTTDFDVAWEDPSDLTQFATAAQGAKADSAYQKPATGIPLTDLTNDLAEAVPLAHSAYQKPTDGIPVTDLTGDAQNSLQAASTAYQKPSSGIPTSDLEQAIQNAVVRALSAYQKPVNGIPQSDLEAAIIASLTKANTALQSYTETDPTVPPWAKEPTKPTYTAKEVNAYVLPTDGIPITDLAPTLQNSIGKANSAMQSLDAATVASLHKADTALQSFTEVDPTVPSWAKQPQKPTYGVAEITGAYAKPSAGIPATDLAKIVLGTTPVPTNGTYNGKIVYKYAWKGVLSTSNNADGMYFTVPKFSDLVTCTGWVLDKNSYTKRPVPFTNDSGYQVNVRFSGGDVWIRSVEANGAFNGSDIFLEVRYTQA